VDYRRIFSVIFTILEGRAIVERACNFFAIAGAEILREHYKRHATAVSGAALYVTSTQPLHALMFAKSIDEKIVSAPDAFHSWIECDGFAIDFMAPIFRENLQAQGYAGYVPRRMFQKPLDEMTPPSEFSEEGQFFLSPDVERTQAMMTNFLARPVNSDLLDICLRWYRRPPRRIADQLAISNDLGEPVHLRLHGPDIAGSW
jgi:hypothetical protein